eukprot:8616918-Lingulodinium_polyedra.AAC.1
MLAGGAPLVGINFPTNAFKDQLAQIPRVGRVRECFYKKGRSTEAKEKHATLWLRMRGVRLAQR